MPAGELFDGAWWPRSRDMSTELSGPIAALSEYLGPITRVGPDAGAWDELPTRLIVDDRVVHIDSFPVGDDTVLITRGERDHYSLLVVPRVPALPPPPEHRPVVPVAPVRAQRRQPPPRRRPRRLRLAATRVARIHTRLGFRLRRHVCADRRSARSFVEAGLETSPATQLNSLRKQF
jgi:hypothetical protein